MGSQGIAFGRLARLPSYILGLEISEGAVVNMQDAARNTFARQTRYIRTRLMSGATSRMGLSGASLVFRLRPAHLATVTV
jgi:hypothetical protein